VEVAVGVGLAVLLVAILYFLRRGATNEVAREQAEALLALERSRMRALEMASEAERQARAKELDAKIADVRTSADAVRLVRLQLSSRRTRRPL
jgi:hypothetical protein